MSAQPHTDDSPWTINRLLLWTAEYLARHGIEEPRLASELLLAHATHQRRIDLYARPEEVPDQERIERFRALVKRAARHEPIAYLVEEKEFFSLPFRVTPDVLIPRPETEVLVEMVIDHCTGVGLTAPHLLDLGTGSGCMAIAVLTQLKGARVVASDVSAAALPITRQNAERHGVTDRLVVVEADRLALPAEAVPEGGFDVLMANPPYVAREIMHTLAAGVREFEPETALTDGDDGLTFYRTIATEGGPLLAPKGAVFVEVGDGQASAVVAMMAGSGTFTHVRSRKDQVVGQERALMFARCA